MDPIRRLILLGIVASVILAEPSQARALFAARDLQAERQPATATQRFIRQLAVVLRQTVKPVQHRLKNWHQPLELLPQSGSIVFERIGRPLQLHLFDLPPPLG